MKITPVRDLILVSKVTPEETTEGGILIPELAQKSNLVRILNTGEDSEFKEYVGATILVLNGGPKHFPGMDENEALVRPEDVLGIVDTA